MSKHRSALFSLLPRGDVYPKEGDRSTLGDLFSGIAASLDTFEQTAFQELVQSFPDQTGNYLEDWERLLDLPFAGTEGLSVEERRNTVVAMLTTSPESSRTFFENLALVFGYEIIITRDLYSLFQAGTGKAGEQLNGQELSYVWKVSTTGVVGPDIGLESVINFFKPAHTYVIYEYL